MSGSRHKDTVKNKSFIPLKFKLVFLIVATIILFGSLATFGVYVYSKQVLLENTKDALSEKTIIQTRSIESYLNQAKESLINLSKDAEIVDYYSTKDDTTDRDSIDEKLKLIKSNQSLLDVYLLDRQGICNFSTDLAFLNQNYSFRSYFKDALANKKGFEVSLSVTSGQLGLYISEPIYNKDSFLSGVAVIRLDTKFFSQIFNSRIFDKINVLITDKNGIIIFSKNNTQDLFKTIKSLDEPTLKEIEVNKNFLNVKIEPYQRYSDLNNIFTDNLSQQQIYINDKLDNKSRVLTYNKIFAGQINLIVDQSLEEIESFTVSIALILSLFVMLCALFATFVIHAYLLKILKPLDLISESMDEITAGSKTIKIEINSNDEFKILANTINKMVDKNNINIIDIEKKILQRTSQLEKINNFMIGREFKMKQLKDEISLLKKKIREYEDKE